MFNDAKWEEIISTLKNLPANHSGCRKIFTKSRNQLNLVSIVSNEIFVATKKDWNKFNEIPKAMFETIYNALVKGKKLSQNEISKGLLIKRSAFVIAVLEMLPEIKYEESCNSLVYLESVMKNYRIEMDWLGKRIITLNDIIDFNLRILIIGLNPSLISVEAGHYYQGKLGLQLWSLMTEYKILPNPNIKFSYHDQYLIKSGFGATDIVKRPTKSADEIMNHEYKHGKEILLNKIKSYKPKILLFVFKKVAEKLMGISLKNKWGFIDKSIYESEVFILPFPYRKRDIVEFHLNELVLKINTFE